MTRTRIPAGALLFAASLLQSCGGGGGGEGGGGNGDPHASARVSFSKTSISAAATPGELAPEDTITFEATNNPPPEIYVGFDHSGNGIEHIEFNQTGPAEGTIKVVFRLPGSLLNGTYADTIEAYVCFDIECRAHLNGSPRTINSSYTVSGEGRATATLSRDVIELTADQRESTQRRESMTATIADIPPAGLYVETSHSSNAVTSVGRGAVGEVTNMTVDFRAPDELALGTYTDTINVRICYADNCVRQVPGSPFAVSTSYHVMLGVEPGLPQLQYLSQTPLGHDVIDAEYSAALNAIVTISGYPDNAIHVFDIDTGIESEQLLVRAATSLAISPDGLIASVGHDAFVSIVDLAQVGTAGAPAPTVLNVSIPVHDVALDGDGHVYAVPIQERGDHIHAVDVATNTEQIADGFIERISMQPGTQSLYGVPDSVPSEVRKWDVSTGLPGYLYAWQYFSEHSACLRIWFSESGDRFYTACGGVFSASADPAQDMLHVGTMALTEPVAYDENYIESLSHSQADAEIAVIEWHFFDCRIGPLYRPCYTRLAYFDDDTYARQALYGIGPLTTGGAGFAQRGRYIFHDGQSSRKYLISELEEPPGEDQRFWLSVIE